MDELKITVLAGGRSAERQVSLGSGAAVARALRSLGHEVHELDPCPDSWELPSGTEVVFLALHGTYGEDGTVQQLLEDWGVPYTGCDPESSRVAFDKVETKRRCLGEGIFTPRWMVLKSPIKEWPEGWRAPVVLKPPRQGSSIGLHFVERQEDWAAAVTAAFQTDSKILLEDKIVGREVTAGILEGEALPLVEIRPKRGAYDYHHKYTPGATDYLCPADFSASDTARIQEAGKAAFAAIGGRDYGRVDFIAGPDGVPALLEVNTLPGMTETSLLPKAAAAAGITFPNLCQRMVQLALERKTGRKTVRGN